MRLRLYGAQLSPGDDVRPYVRTDTPQQLSGIGRVFLRWGTSLGFDSTDPAWTKEGARFSPGTLLTATVDQGDADHTQLPYTPGTSSTFSGLLRLRFPLPQVSCHLTDLGGFGLGALQDGTLTWWIGLTHYASSVAPSGDEYVHLIAATSPTGVRLWVNGRPALILPVSNTQAPTGYTIGGPGAAFDLATVTLYTRAVGVSEVPQMYVYNQLLAQDLELPTRFGRGVALLLGNTMAFAGQSVTAPPFNKTL